MMELLAVVFVVVSVVVVLMVRNNKKTVDKYVSGEEAKVKADAAKLESAVKSEIKKL